MQSTWFERRFAFLLGGYGLVIGLIVAHPIGGIDDAYYYLKIADHLARGDGSTFDGIHLTNGYHPLWLFTLVPIFWITPDPEPARAFSIMFQAVFYAVGIAMFYATARLQVSRLPALIGAFLWSLLVYRQSLSGLEFALYAMTIGLTGYFYLSWISGLVELRKFLILGILVSLVFLARVDAILLALSIGLALGAREWIQGFHLGSLKRLLAYGLPVLITVCVFALVNWGVFGNALPISSAVKQSWSVYYLAQNPNYQQHGWLSAKIETVFLPLNLVFQSRHLLDLLYPLYLTVGTGIAGLIWFSSFRFGGEWSRRAIQPLAPFILFSGLSFIAYALIYQGWIVFGQYWYYAIQPWLAALFFGILLDRIYARARKVWACRLATLALVAFCIGIPVYTLRQFFSFNFGGNAPSAAEPFEQIARWLSANTPPDAVVGAWNAGIISYYSGRRVINLDGLVNSWDYFRYERFDLCHYWQSNQVRYVADVFVGNESAPLPVYNDYARCADRLELLWSRDSVRPNTSSRIYQFR